MSTPARLNHVLRDAQKVCALTIVGTILKGGKLGHKLGLGQTRKKWAQTQTVQILLGAKLPQVVRDRFLYQ